MENLNRLLATVSVLNQKLLNWHWNITGPWFAQIHAKTEEYYNHYAIVKDDLAERILQLGSSPYATLAEYIEHSYIKEEQGGKKYKGEEVLAGLEADFLSLKKIITETDGDAVTQAFLDEQLTFLDKELWMIKAQRV